MNGSLTEQNEGRDFQFLYQAFCNNIVSCVAKRRQNLRQINKPAVTPVTTDLIDFKST